MVPNIILEVAVFGIEAALSAIKAGAQRIEFCENPLEGGTTPSHGSLVSLIAKTTVPVFPIVRPRGGDFLYTEIEFETIIEDIKFIKSIGYKGAVIGFLNKDGSIDKKRTKTIVELAAPMEITFHRAFDRCHNPLQAIEDLIEVGCKRILTSAQVPNVMEGLDVLKTFVDKAAGRIIILPGSGVRAKNCRQIIDTVGAIEIHSSARTAAPSLMEYINPSMKENLQSTLVDEQEIKAMLEALV